MVSHHGDRGGFNMMIMFYAMAMMLRGWFVAFRIGGGLHGLLQV